MKGDSDLVKSMIASVWLTMNKSRVVCEGVGVRGIRNSLKTSDRHFLQNLLNSTNSVIAWENKNICHLNLDETIRKKMK